MTTVGDRFMVNFVAELNCKSTAMSMAYDGTWQCLTGLASFHRKANRVDNLKKLLTFPLPTPKIHNPSEFRENQNWS